MGDGTVVHEVAEEVVVVRSDSPGEMEREMVDAESILKLSGIVVVLSKGDRRALGDTKGGYQKMVQCNVLGGKKVEGGTEIAVETATRRYFVNLGLDAVQTHNSSKK